MWKSKLKDYDPDSDWVDKEKSLWDKDTTEKATGRAALFWFRVQASQSWEAISNLYFVLVGSV